jgi:hypothetical protein
VIQPTEKFIIRHVGIVNEKCDPKPFMVAIQKLMADNPEFKSKLHIDFVGEVHSHFKNFVLESLELSSITTFTPSRSHDQLISMYGEIIVVAVNSHRFIRMLKDICRVNYLSTWQPVCLL